MRPHCHSRPSPTRPAGPDVCSFSTKNDVADRLATLDDVTDGALRWSETAGLKQVVRSIDITEDATLRYAQTDYGKSAKIEAA